jgi:NAD(P)-dependent dehydrogenase (short-subunit alcohol dehydrogenase family)
MLDLKGKTVLVTGSTDGLGRELASACLQEGATLLAHGRNLDKGTALMTSLRQEFPGATIRYYNANLASLEETFSLCRRLLENEEHLEVLVNNAGIGPRSPGLPRRVTEDNLELMFQVNYLAGYILARRLLPILKINGARIVNVASIGQQALDFSNLQLEHDFDDARAYRQSKLAQILDTLTLTTSLEGMGITVNAGHPATLMGTKMVLDSEGYFPGVKTSVAEGVNNIMHLIADDSLQNISGLYFEDQQPTEANAQAYERSAREKLASISAEIIANY